jgi:methionyl-tRNA formyltransferase
MKNVIFFGTPEIAVPALHKLTTLKQYKLIGVGTFPDKPVGRKQILTSNPVKKFVQERDIPLQIITQKKDILSWTTSVNFDIAIVIAFGMIFPEEVLKNKKFINVHFSLLPKYRGASPVQSAILAGEKETGITFQCMQKELDAGDILWQEKYPLKEEKTSQVFSFLAEKTAEILPVFLNIFFAGEISPTPQKKSQVSFCRKFTKSDGEIFPQSQTAEEIFRASRAFNIFPGIFLKTKKGNMKLTQISLFFQKGSISLPCAKNTELFIQKVHLPGKKEQPITEVLKGNPQLFDVGESFL